MARAPPAFVGRAGAARRACVRRLRTRSRPTVGGVRRHLDRRRRQTAGRARRRRSSSSSWPLPCGELTLEGDRGRRRLARAVRRSARRIRAARRWTTTSRAGVAAAALSPLRCNLLQPLALALPNGAINVTRWIHCG